METPQNTVSQDPLGLKRFALTESAYDLLRSIQGGYARLSYAESQKKSPDKNLINYWRERSNEMGRVYRQLTGYDLSAIDNFIQVATNEWHLVAKLESERISVPHHAS